METDLLTTDISRHIWDTKYRFKQDGDPVDRSIEDTWRRVARALAAVEAETGLRRHWEEEFYHILENFRFLPGGRIQAGAGTGHRVTLFNCFVMGMIEDTIPSIFEGLRESALTMQQGGGIGCDFSTLRPRGTRARSSNNISSGPVSFMKIWNSMCETMVSTGARRGAMMATLRCDHPDIEEFIAAKQEPGTLTNFNLSVLVTDAFMQAVDSDSDWHLVFPDEEMRLGEAPGEATTVNRSWSGSAEPVRCRVFRTVRARELWERIMKATYSYAEPGVLFVDRINRLNNLGYCEQISCTNPCGEVPLPAYGACNLGSVNLTQFVRFPFTEKARLDLDGISETAGVAARMLDNVISVSRFPIQKQRRQATNSRRIGMGITGLADALIMLGLRYDSQEAGTAASSVMETIRDAAYNTSALLAREKGSFPLFEKTEFLSRPFIRELPAEIRKSVERNGIRNSHLISIAPTGSISILAGNLSSGLEPVFDFRHSRTMLNTDGSKTRFEVVDYAYRLWQSHRDNGRELPPSFVTATEIAPEAHLDMQAALQPYVDNSISKTINIPETYPFESFSELYRQAYEKKLKGCTTFRPNPVTGTLLERSNGETQVHCCTLEREAD